MSASSAIRIAPSILSADFSKLGDEIRAIDEAGADYIHVDVMDGHFVPNITMGPNIVAAIRPHTKKVMDCHLMIAPADPFLEAFAKAGADIITIHPEAGPHLHRSLQTIRALGKKAGVALNPATATTVLDDIMDLVDLVLVMTVNPGFGGQAYIPLEAKIANVKARIAHACAKTAGRAIDLQVDGGITVDTAPKAIAAGADVLVAGTAVFKGGPGQYAHAIKSLRG